MRPTIVLVHGAFAESASWNRVLEPLLDAGHRVIAAPNPLRGVAADAAAVGDLIRTVDGPVVLVGHSYGGAVITGAGRAANVVGLVYIAGFAPDEGEAVSSMLAGADPAPGLASIVPAFDESFLWHGQDTFHDSFCQDLDETESMVLATSQRPTARRCFDEVTGQPAWKTKPSWYQVSTQDRMIRPQDERWMAQRIRARETIELDTSHASFATRPAEVLELIISAADAV
jgi:pimeloyl-ACP methyl ester carboxylesterase